MKLIKIILLLLLSSSVFSLVANAGSLPVSQKIMCPDVNNINTAIDGTILPPPGWFVGQCPNCPFYVPYKYMNTWRNDITSVLYTQPLNYYWGTSFSCQYFTPYSGGYGLFVIFMLSPSPQYNLWDISESIPMGNCTDTNSHGSGVCYWSESKN